MIHYKKMEAGLWILVPDEFKGYSFNAIDQEWVPFDSLRLLSFYSLFPGAEHFIHETGRAVYVSYIAGSPVNIFEGAEDEEYHYAIGYSMYEVALMAGPELPSNDFELVEIEEFGDKFDYTSGR